MRLRNAIRDSWIHLSVKGSVALPFRALPVGKRRFSRDLISHNLPSWEQALAPYRGKPGVHYLEVGVLEGQSLLWMLENVLTHPSSRATAIDPLSPVYYWTLWRNLATAEVPSKVRFITRRSQEALPRLPRESFDIIYIDGSHEPEYLKLDLESSWPLLKAGGMLIIDDYEWGEREGVPPAKRPKPVIHSFLANCPGKVIHEGWQVIVKTGSRPESPGR